MGAVPKVRIGDKTLFLSRSRTLKKFFARYDNATNIGNASLYGLQKYELKYGLSLHIKIRIVSKVSFTCKIPFFFKSQTLKYFFLLDLVISLRKVVYLHIICGNM